ALLRASRWRTRCPMRRSWSRSGRSTGVCVSMASVPLPATVPLVDDVLRPACHRVAGMEGERVGGAGFVGIVPDQQQPGARFDGHVEPREVGFATLLDRVQVGHRGYR